MIDVTLCNRRANCDGAHTWTRDKYRTFQTPCGGTTLDAHNANVQDVLPANLLDATRACNLGGGATCTANGTGSIMDAVNIPHGAGVTYHLTVTALAIPDSRWPIPRPLLPETARWMSTRATTRRVPPMEWAFSPVILKAHSVPAEGLEPPTY